MPSGDPHRFCTMPKEVMWRVLGFIDESQGRYWAAVARRWLLARAREDAQRELSNSPFLPQIPSVPRAVGLDVPSDNGMPSMALDFLDPQDRSHIPHLARAWAAYLSNARGGAVVTGEVDLAVLGFVPDAGPDPLDATGRLPNELLERMFDYLDEDQTLHCATVARRWRSSAMELILASILSPILWAIPDGAVRCICSNLHPNDIEQVACVCQDWRQLALELRQCEQHLTA
ncbi:unnamed protein product [Discosporangium mesarthrocarpum]